MQRRVRLGITLCIWALFVGVAVWGRVERRAPSYEAPLEILVVDECYPHESIANILMEIGIENYEIRPALMDSLVLMVVGEQLPDVVVLSETNASCLLDSTPQLLVDLTPYVLNSSIDFYDLDYSGLHYPCYWNRCFYFLPTTTTVQRKALLHYYNEDGKVGSIKTIMHPEQKVVIGILTSNTRNEETTQDLFQGLELLTASRGHNAEWRNYIGMLTRWLFATQDANTLYKAFLHSSLRETWDFSQWQSFFQGDFLPSLPVAGYPRWTTETTREVTIELFDNPWNNLTYEDVLQINIKVNMSDTTGRYIIPVHHYIYLAKDIWFPPDDTLPLF
jgi:hypothetical protein